MSLSSRAAAPVAAERNARQSPLEVARQALAHDHLLGRGGCAARLARPRHEAHDLAPAQLIKGCPAGNLVHPRPGAIGVFERVPGAISLDKGFLRQIGRQLVVSHHATEIGINLRVMSGIQALDKRPSASSVVAHSRSLSGEREPISLSCGCDGRSSPAVTRYRSSKSSHERGPAATPVAIRSLARVSSNSAATCSGVMGLTGSPVPIRDRRSRATAGGSPVP